MSQIKISELTFAYDGSYDNVFDKASVQLDTAWNLGLIGRNGRGKTTLLRLLCGALDAHGAISASVSFEYFPYAVIDMSRAAREVAQEIAGHTEPWRLARELSLLGVPEEALERPYETLSHGERTKVQLAAFFVRDNSFPLLDEPTNHLDAEGRALVARYLKSKSGFLLVSHDRDFLDACVDHVLAINKTGFELQNGNFSSWNENRMEQDAREQAENERLRGEMRRLTDAARRAATWSDKTESTKKSAADSGFVGHKAAKMMKRSKNIERRRNEAAERKGELLHDIETAEPLKLWPVAFHSDRLFEVNALSPCYGGRSVCEPQSFAVRRGDRLRLAGGNGSGKSSVLRLFAGEQGDYTGELWRAAGLTVSYMPQSTAHLRGTLRDYAEACAVDETLFLSILRKLDFARLMFEKDMRDYSEGQRKKVLLARSLCERAHVYLWDEPLNYIDVFSRMQIEDLLRDYAPTMVFVEHDEAFARAVATKTIRL
ncbi:MAG: Lsa family ABC-F type ribosomal protection protein [Clostridium sp. SCN 57-10]|nr:MAG: Lsa family ABC-F type ribosomal protection protein [Clostridium sp. SCN 57-10]